VKSTIVQDLLHQTNKILTILFFPNMRNEFCGVIQCSCFTNCVNAGLFTNSMEENNKHIRKLQDLRENLIIFLLSFDMMQNTRSDRVLVCDKMIVGPYILERIFVGRRFPHSSRLETGSIPGMKLSPQCTYQNLKPSAQAPR